MKAIAEFIDACRTRPRDVARALVARLTADELSELIERLQVEAAVMAEFRDMLAEGRKVHRTRKPERPSSDRFVDSVDCWLSDRRRDAA